MVTIKDIAQEVGVSPSTVSRALSDSPLISTTTKERVRAVAERLGYEPNELARALVKGSSGAVGLIVPDITNPFFADIARGVGEAARAAGYGVLLCNTGERPDRELDYIHLLHRKRVDGLLITSVTIDDPHLEFLIRTPVPYVLVSRLSQNDDVPYVIGDDHAGARLAVEHLIDLGHTKIGFVGGPVEVQSSRDRMQTFRQVMREHGIAPRAEWIRHSNFTQAAGREVGRRMLSLTDRPTAIFAANDVIALGVLEAADALRISIPDELSLVGYDDISYAALPRIQLTTVAQPAFEMGKIAADWLFAVIKGEDLSPIHRVLKPHLIVRRTTISPISS